MYYRYLVKFFNVDSGALLREVSYYDLDQAKKDCMDSRFTKCLILDLLADRKKNSDSLAEKIIYSKGF